MKILFLRVLQGVITSMHYKELLQALLKRVSNTDCYLINSVYRFAISFMNSFECFY